MAELAFEPRTSVMTTTLYPVSLVMGEVRKRPANISYLALRRTTWGAMAGAQDLIPSATIPSLRMTSWLPFPVGLPLSGEGVVSHL